MAHDSRSRRILACATLALIVGCAEKPHGRPTFLLETQGTPNPGLIKSLGRLLDVDLQPSFIDVRSIRNSLHGDALSGAFRLECRNRFARGFVHIRSEVGTHWTDSARGFSSAFLSVLAQGCGGADDPFFAHSFWFFRPRIVDQPTGNEIRAASAAAADAVLRRLSLDLKNEPDKLNNLRTFGLAMRDADVSTLCQFTTGVMPSWLRTGLRAFGEGWTVENIDPNGSAARAGVRLGDVFIKVNGAVPTMLNYFTLPKRADASGTWDVEYVSPSGVRRTVHYAARDVRWYTTHT